MAKKVKTPKAQPVCEHKWKRYGHRGGGKGGQTFVCLTCDKCKEHSERPATEPERKKIHADKVLFERRQKLMHKAWRPVQKLWEDIEKSGVGWPRGDSETAGGKDKLAAGMERLAKRFPEHIHNARVDDDYHASSDLWFISHFYDDEKVGRGYWGTSVVYIGQCSDDPPVRFFLYPDSHMKYVLATATKLHKKARALNKGKRYGEV